MPTLQVITLGCSKNTVDTEHLLHQVRGSYEIVPEGEDRPVDVLAINTCGFIGDAKEQSINTILAAAGRKNAGLAGRLVVFGCLSQRYPDQLPGLIPEVDGWYGARELDSLVKALGCVPDHSEDYLRVRTDRKPYAYLKISEGCNRRCSYCAIPFIRGAHKSVPMVKLVDEARSLAADGVRELIIIAQDTTYYGLDLYGRRALAELLDRLSEVEGIERMRIHYSYPQDFPEDVLDRMANNPKVCRYMDIPLQHISDKVLDNMHRGVDGAWTRALVQRMRDKVPGLVLRTTFIVGHPGEGPAEFRELMNFVRETGFQRMGAFAYSEEEGTFGADYLKDSVSPRTKKSRLSRLMELQRGISLAYNQSRIGTVQKVLVDAFSDGILICRSEFESPEVDGEILVKYSATDFDGKQPESLIGEFLDVRITGADEYDLTAEVL
ncbi:MAG: 30S ribosomal protein S12 methylthiotransferase RimO [Bacteroidales bacterium]|nr:30S ribosomal protein S12 methylthiotransferase RimO [Bacteroidales bacterium]